MKVKKKRIKVNRGAVKSSASTLPKVPTEKALNCLSVLRKQVRALLATEEGMNIDQRKCFEWQLLVHVGAVPYVVGKAGANTMYFRIGAPKEGVEPEVMYPDEMLALIDGWCKSTYAVFQIRVGSEVALDGIETEDAALKKKPKTFQKNMHIVGVKANGQVDDLHVLKSGLNGLHWVKV